MSRAEVGAIVLAGGRSSRFGRDKLAEPLRGRTLLRHAIECVAPFAAEVIVVVAPDAAPSVPPGVRLVHDPARFEGPLAGLLAGLEAAHGPVILVTAGDMPELQPDVIEALLAAFQRRGTEAAVLQQAGRSRPLPMAIKRDPARREAARLIEAGERRLGALIDVLATTAIPEAAWRAHDRDGRSVRDIDTPEDLP